MLCNLAEIMGGILFFCFFIVNIFLYHLKMEDCREPMDWQSDDWTASYIHVMPYLWWSDMLQDTDWSALDAFIGVPDE